MHSVLSFSLPPLSPWLEHNPASIPTALEHPAALCCSLLVAQLQRRNMLLLRKQYDWHASFRLSPSLQLLSPEAQNTPASMTMPDLLCFVAPAAASVPRGAAEAQEAAAARGVQGVCEDRELCRPSLPCPRNARNCYLNSTRGTVCLSLFFLL